MHRSLALLLLLLLTAACVPGRTISVSEFKGFCYQYDAGPERACVPIATCDEYLGVLENRQPSREACLEACQEVYKAQVQKAGFTGCLGAPGNSRDWCQKVCRSNYPK